MTLDFVLQMDVERYKVRIAGILKPKYRSFSYKVFLSKVRERDKKVCRPWFGRNRYW